MPLKDEMDPAVAVGQASSAPKVTVGAGKRPLAEAAANLLVKVVVDQHVNLPGTFELTFLDPTLKVLADAGLSLGTKVQIQGMSREGGGMKPLLEGEVVALEGDYNELEALTIVRGATLDHKMQRMRQSRTFLKVKDSDVASKLAQEAGLSTGKIEATSFTHEVLEQDDLTDWQFLRWRAAENGYDVGFVDGKFQFCKGRTTSGAAVTLERGSSLVTFRPRVSAAGLPGEVEVRAWDPVNAKAVAASAPVSSKGVAIGVGDAGAAAAALAGTKPPAAPPKPGGADLGPAPKAGAYVVADQTTHVDRGTAGLTAVATALADQLGNGFAEAEGECLGDSRVSAGAVVEVAGVPKEFAGKWTITRARHVFDRTYGQGYRTAFTASGRADRTLRALVGGTANSHRANRIHGVVGAVVTDVNDPQGLARVKLALPWLSPTFETDWAPVTQLDASTASGTMFLPSAGDAVLVSFEFGDLRRPYVLGSLVNKRTGAGGLIEPGGNQPSKSAVGSGNPASVIRRGLVSPSGNRLVFHDDGPPKGGKPTAAKVILGTKGDKLGLTLDAVGGKLLLVCKPGSPPGTLTIECDGKVEIKAGASGSMTIDGGTNLTLKAKQVTMEGEATTTIKGKTVNVEGEATAALKGKIVNVEGVGPTAIKGKPLQLN